MLSCINGHTICILSICLEALNCTLHICWIYHSVAQITFIDRKYFNLKVQKNCTNKERCNSTIMMDVIVLWRCAALSANVYLQWKNETASPNVFITKLLILKLMKYKTFYLFRTDEVVDMDEYKENSRLHREKERKEILMNFVG